MKIRLSNLSECSVNRGFKQEVVMKETHRVDAIETESLLLKHPKLNRDSDISINLSPSTGSIYLCHQVTKSPRLKYTLPAPPRDAFQNDKSLKDKLIRSKLKNPNKRELGNYKCGGKLCQISDIISLQN